MARLARLVVPNYPHHIVQRGNRSQIVFFNNADRIYYLSLLSKFSKKHEISVWGYCLMTNHVHLIVVLTFPQ